MNDLISVVVPIYNVEKYLKRCIDSIICQKYNNIEILLIDDGSTDSCNKICDNYKKIDNRIVVIHKKNGGLSDARNTGIKQSKGKYICFIDSDDYISPNCIESLYNNLMITKSDISCCDFFIFNETEDMIESEINNLNLTSDNIYIANKVDALEKMMYREKFRNSACAKLFKKDLFKKVLFPKGKICEDLGTMYKICISNQKYYYYMQRSKSIIHSTFNINRMDGLEFAIEETDFIYNNYPEIINAAYNREFMEAIYILIRIPFKYEYKNQISKISKSIKKTRKKIIFDKKSSLKTKILSFVSYLGIIVLKIVVSIKK